MDPDLQEQMVNSIYRLARHLTKEELKDAVSLRPTSAPAPLPPERPTFVEQLFDPCQRMLSEHEKERYGRRLEHQRNIEEIAYEAEVEEARVAKETLMRKKQNEADAYVDSEGRLSQATGALHEAKGLEEILDRVNDLDLDPVLLEMLGARLHTIFGRGGGCYDQAT
jgi:hypothetical protein